LNRYSNSEEKEALPCLTLYNKTTIFLTAVFMNTFVGAIFYSMNLQRVGKKTQIPPVLIFGLLLHFTNLKYYQYLPYNIPSKFAGGIDTN
jgi:hypothetical protein